MTFDAKVNAKFEEIPAVIRDAVSTLNGYSIIDDSTNGASTFAQGDYFAFDTPKPDDFLVELSGPRIIIESGDYDTGGNFNTKYTADLNPDLSFGSFNASDDFQYWLNYKENYGFAGYFERVEADGDDTAALFGIAEINKVWNYENAAADEGFYSGLEINGSSTKINTTFDQFGSNNKTVNARGQVNDDANFNNFPSLKTSIIASDKFGTGAVIGTHEAWLKDNSGTKTAHLDEITQNNTATYKVFKNKLNDDFAIKMT